MRLSEANSKRKEHTMTKLYFHRGGEVRVAYVPDCPMFDFDGANSTAEVRSLTAEGFAVTGHVDGVTEGN